MQEDRIYPKADLSDPDRARPRQLLSNSTAYFEALFEVLSLGKDSVVAASWSLIQLLPINDRILHALTAIKNAASEGDINWNELFSASAPLKLLYSLKIVDKYVNPAARESDEDKAAYRQWRDAFVANKGVVHLVHVLNTCDIDSWMQSTLPQTCLTLLIKLIVDFIGAERFDEQIPVLAKFDVVALAQRLYRAVEFAVRSAASAVDKKDDDEFVFEVQDEGALALAKKKGKGKGGKKDAGTGGDMEDEDMLDLNSVDEESKGEEGESKELLQSKLAPQTKDSQLAQQALALLCTLSYQSEAVRPLFASDSVFPTLLAGLLKVPDVTLRSEIEKGLGNIIIALVYKAGSTAERDLLLSLLVANIDAVRQFLRTFVPFAAA